MNSDFKVREKERKEGRRMTMNKRETEILVIRYRIFGREKYRMFEYLCKVLCFSKESSKKM